LIFACLNHKYDEKEILGGSADLIFTEEDRAAGIPAQEAATAVTKGHASDERWHVRKEGSLFWGSGAMRWQCMIWTKPRF